MRCRFESTLSEDVKIEGKVVKHSIPLLKHIYSGGDFDIKDVFRMYRTLTDSERGVGLNILTYISRKKKTKFSKDDLEKLKKMINEEDNLTKKG